MFKNAQYAHPNKDIKNAPFLYASYRRVKYLINYYTCRRNLDCPPQRATPQAGQGRGWNLHSPAAKPSAAAARWGVCWKLLVYQIHLAAQRGIPRGGGCKLCTNPPQSPSWRIIFTPFGIHLRYLRGFVGFMKLKIGYVVIILELRKFLEKNTTCSRNGGEGFLIFLLYLLHYHITFSSKYNL